MKSQQVSAGDYGRIFQYNDLRQDAFAASWLMPHAQSTPDLTIKVENGYVYFNSSFVAFAGGNSPSFTAPVTNPRIDVLSIDPSGTLVRTAGTENASPVAPEVPDGNLPICRVYNRVGQTLINDSDTGSNGYIQTDLRPYLRTVQSPEKSFVFGESISANKYVFQADGNEIDVRTSDLQNVSGSANVNSTSWRAAQTFVSHATASAIRHVRFAISRNGNLSGNFNVKVYATDVNGKPTGSSLGASDNYSASNLGPAATPTTAGNMVPLRFSTPVSISPSTKYALVLDFSGVTFGASTIQVGYPASASGAGSGATASTDGGATWTTPSGGYIFIAGQGLTNGYVYMVNETTAGDGYGSMGAYTGITSEAGTTGQTKKVKLAPSIVGGFSGLSAGPVYIDRTSAGDITQVGANSGRMVGRAVSSTEVMLIQMEKFEAPYTHGSSGGYIQYDGMLVVTSNGFSGTGSASILISTDNFYRDTGTQYTFANATGGTFASQAGMSFMLAAGSGYVIVNGGNFNGATVKFYKKLNG